jgi:anti-sigma regulatory factor (Ser/Thr protein kinase)
VRQTQTFPAEAQSVPAARRFATRLLAGSGPDVLQAAELMVSELATNSVRHGNTRFDLTIERTSNEIRVEVTDQGGGTPALRSPGPDEPTGRGLRIVDMLSDQWGVERRVGGKTVWFMLAVGPSGRAGVDGAWSPAPQPLPREPAEPALHPAPAQDPALGDERALVQPLVARVPLLC